MGCCCENRYLKKSPTPPPPTCDFTDEFDYALTGASTPWSIAFGDPENSGGQMILTTDDIVERLAVGSSGWYCRFTLDMTAAAPLNTDFFMGIQLTVVGQNIAPTIRYDGVDLLLGGSWYGTPASYFGSSASPWDWLTHYAITPPFTVEIFYQHTSLQQAGRVGGSGGIFSGFYPILVPSGSLVVASSSNGATDPNGLDKVDPICWIENLSDAEVAALV